MKKAKIIATIRDTYKEQDLINIYKAWANIVRFNFPHAQYDTTAPVIKLIHELNEKWLTNLWVLVDTKGPGVRTWARENPYTYKKWEEFRIFIDDSLMDKDSDMLCDYPYLLEDIKIWDKIEIESWLMEVTVKEINPNYIIVISEHNLEIWSRRHINFPWMSLKFPWLTEQDKKDLLFSLEQWIEYVAISFVRTKENIQEVKAFLHENNADHVQIIAKIENQEWLENIDEITQISDAIMIARWDLWIEVPIVKLPFYQTYILNACKKRWKPAIMATELLKTMVNSPIPTRAEISDVYNSRILWADVLMLSEETAIGKFPIQAVEIMSKTIEEAESNIFYTHEDFELIEKDDISIWKKSLVKHALSLADELKINHVLVFTTSGHLAKYVSALKPNQHVFACCSDQKIVNWLNILAGIHWIKMDEWKEHTSENQEQAIKILKEKNLISYWEKIVIIWDKKRWDSTDPLIRITIVE